MRQEHHRWFTLRLGRDMANLNAPSCIHHLSSCGLRLATCSGSCEVSGPIYRFSELLKSRGIRHTVDDWGPKGGHAWPYWKN